MNTIHRNLFVIFAPGLGGNHICNLLSTSNEFSERFKPTDYKEGDKNAHYYSVQNIETTDIKNNIDVLSNQSNVMCGHWASYYWLLQEGLGDYFPNRQILLIEPPVYDSVAYQRLIQYTNAYSNRYFYEEMKTLYTIDIMEKVCNDTDFFVLNADLIFQSKINRFIEKAEEEFCIKLNHNVCNSIHEHWFNNILKEI